MRILAAWHRNSGGFYKEGESRGIAEGGAEE